MNYIFFGSPKFAAIVLNEAAKAGFSPSIVITNPDRPAGRKKILTPPPVKLAAEKLKIPILQPEKLTPQIFGSRTSEKTFFYSFFLVAAYGKLIPEKILEIPRFGVLNIHPSLLPIYRGPTPIQTAILNGDKETGVSLMLLDKELDHGPIIAREKITIAETDTTETLSERLATLGVKLLIQIIPDFLDNKIKPIPQNHLKASITKKFETGDAFVKYKDLADAVSGKSPEKAKKINCLIHALNPEPGTWTITGENPILNISKNKRVKLLESEAEGDTLILKKIQVEGKNPYFV